MNDLISRQAAIDALEKVAELFPWRVPGNRDTYDRYNEAWNDAIGRAEIEIEELPSAQPEPCDDAVSRKAAIDAALSAFSRGLLASPDIRKLPSVQPEPHWIPVSERLPEEKDAGILKKLGTEKRSEYVLATVEVKGERMTVTACTYDGKWDWNMKYAFPDFKVVAWMPLPEPYREERREE